MQNLGTWNCAMPSFIWPNSSSRLISLCYQDFYLLVSFSPLSVSFLQSTVPLLDSDSGFLPFCAFLLYTLLFITLCGRAGDYARSFECWFLFHWSVDIALRLVISSCSPHFFFFSFPVIRSCSTLCNTMDCSQPGSSVPEILQARILGWVAICFSRGSYRSRDWTHISCLVGRFFTIWATKKAS